MLLSIIGTAVIVLFVFLVVRNQIKNPQVGDANCGGDCGTCLGGCSKEIVMQKEMERAKAEYERVKELMKKRIIVAGIEGITSEKCEEHIVDTIREEYPKAQVKASQEEENVVIILEGLITEGNLKALIEGAGYTMTSYYVEEVEETK